MPSSGTNDYDYSKIQGLPEVDIRISLLMERLRNCVSSRASRILEVGIGAGDVTIELAGAFSNVTSVDMDEAWIALARNRIRDKGLQSPRFVLGKIEDVEFPEGEFDHIILLGILEHLQDPPRVLEVMKGWLNPNGVVYVTVNLAHSLHRRLGVAMGLIRDVEQLGESDRRLGHEWIYTTSLLTDHLRTAGFEVRYSRPFYVKPLPTSMLSNLPMEVHRGLDELANSLPQLASYVYVEAIKVMD